MAVTAHTDQYDGNVANDRSGRTSERRWLEAFLKRFYYAPLLAFWRAIEARALGDAPLPGPSLDIGGHDGAFSATWHRSTLASISSRCPRSTPSAPTAR